MQSRLAAEKRIVTEMAEIMCNAYAMSLSSKNINAVMWNNLISDINNENIVLAWLDSASAVYKYILE